MSGWRGSNSKQSLWDTTISNMCPNCGLAQETSKHLTWCSHSGRVELFRSLITDVISCFEQANVDVDLITIIADYLLLQVSGTMVSQTPIGSKYMPLSRIQDQLGWDCFVEGQIPIALLKMIRPFLSPRKSIILWGVKLTKSLLSVTHRQWLFRNADIHHRFDGLTMHQHTLLHHRITDLLKTSPQDLLPKHRYLLQQDFA